MSDELTFIENRISKQDDGFFLSNTDIHGASYRIFNNVIDSDSYSGNYDLHIVFDESSNIFTQIDRNTIGAYGSGQIYAEISNSFAGLENKFVIKNNHMFGQTNRSTVYFEVMDAAQIDVKLAFNRMEEDYR